MGLGEKMGVDAHAYISRDWSLRDIITWIREKFGIETTVKFHDFAPEYYIIRGGDCYFHVHTDIWTPFGRQKLLTTRANNPNAEMLKQIAQHFGGLWQPRDNDNMFEMFEGENWGEDGISFFVREFIANGGTNDDEQGLLEFIKKWREHYR